MTSRAQIERKLHMSAWRYAKWWWTTGQCSYCEPWTCDRQAYDTRTGRAAGPCHGQATHLYCYMVNSQLPRYGRACPTHVEYVREMYDSALFHMAIWNNARKALRNWGK